MIPISLKLSGFLSYRDPVELDFTAFELACISGGNGAGKSSLLDAITWALFGLARKRDDAVINTFSSAAEVVLTFQYEGAVYRIQRTLPRGKTAILEFQILDEAGSGPNNQRWKPLSERTMRETQARIEQTLRLDYDTFVNASFFLQGKADQFTQQKPGDRKRILASILGLDAWEEYRNRTAERRKHVERDLDSVNGRISEINEEINEEDQRKLHLKELEARLEGLKNSRKSQESALEAVRQAAASLAERRKLAGTLLVQLQRNESNLDALQKQRLDRETEKNTYAGLLSRAEQVESNYRDWLAAREALEKWEKSASEFREYERKRQPYLDAINAEKARLVQEHSLLQEQFDELNLQKLESESITKEINSLNEQLASCEGKIEQREILKSQLDSSRERSAALKAESDALKGQMDEHKARLDAISGIETGACPLCGQPLTARHRKSTIERLTKEGKEMGDRWRANKAENEQLLREIKKLENDFNRLAGLDKERLTLSASQTRLMERLESYEKNSAEWNSKGAKRLKEVNKLLEKDNFLPDARKALTALDKEFKKQGYDASAHEAARQAEVALRPGEEEFRSLEKARAAFTPLEREISHLHDQISRLENEVVQLRKEYEQTQAAIDQSPVPDLNQAERELFAAQEQENRLNQEVGAARQKVNVLDELRARKKRLDSDREELASQIGKLKMLERAFGKDGVPALLIEQALPEIETKANEILDRLSNGAMSVRFITQRGYKDNKREDLKETLDIQISDGTGLRDYEMFSGGEVFRVNFAVRLALSEILARRTGARLQTLVIDEGFGSQDTQGRQRLIEAINSVQGDFAKILIITHLDELKEAFPNRIEVEKTPRGSTLQVY
jgi:exonuclease SbcC